MGGQTRVAVLENFQFVEKKRVMFTRGRYKVFINSFLSRILVISKKASLPKNIFACNQKKEKTLKEKDRKEKKRRRKRYR